MIPLGELRVKSTLDSVRTIAAFIQSVGYRLELIEKNLFDIELAVEEAATNIVRHAYAGDENGDILISVEVDGTLLRITFTDWGQALDTENIEPFDADATIDKRARGGMGLYLMEQLMDKVARHNGSKPGHPNTLILTKKLHKLPPGTRRRDPLRELNAVLSVSQSIASGIEIDELLTLMINKLIEAIGAEGGTLYLIDPQKHELYSRLLLEESGDLKEVRVKVGNGVAGHVAETGKTMNIQDAYANPYFDPRFDRESGYRTRTILAAPLRNHQQEIIGVVQLLNKKGEPQFTFRDERLLIAMAAQAAISIENTRLHAQEIEQQLLNQELETARTIQQSFLPDAVPKHEGWEIAAHWHPMREVAGDFYDFYLLPDDRLAVIIADVSGKGVPAALFMALSVTVLRFAMALNLTPRELLDRTNQMVLESQKSRLFLTAFAGYLNLNSGVFHFASAGHNPPLFYNRNKHRCQYLETRGVAVGVFPHAQFAEEIIRLRYGDIVVLYTDGITEIINRDEEEFGEERLETLVLTHATKSAQEIVGLIVKAVKDFAGTEGAFDDETLVVIKCIRIEEDEETEE